MGEKIRVETTCPRCAKREPAEVIAEIITLMRDGIRAASDTMEILTREKVLPSDRSEAFLAMVRFRNRVVHLHDEVHPDEIWSILDSDLGDFEAFIGAVVARYFTE